MVVSGADGCQSPAIGPGHRRPVVPGGRVANGVVADGVPVIGRQQVPSTGVVWDKGPSPVPQRELTLLKFPRLPRQPRLNHPIVYMSTR